MSSSSSSTASSSSRDLAFPAPRPMDRRPLSGICRKHGISQFTYYRWRGNRGPENVEVDRLRREMEIGSGLPGELPAQVYVMSYMTGLRRL